MKLLEYQRVSTDDKGQDPQRQHINNQARAEKDGHEIVGTVVDNKGNHKSSGGIPAMERAGFLEAVEKAKKLKAHGILVESVDRLTKVGWKDLGATLYLLEVEHGLKVIFADLGGTDDDDPNGGLAEVVVPLAAYLARIGRQRLRAMVKTGMQNARRKRHDADRCEDCITARWCAIARQGRPPKDLLTDAEWTLLVDLQAQGWGLGRISKRLTRDRQTNPDGSELVDPLARRRATVSEPWLRDQIHLRSVESPGLLTRVYKPCHPNPRPKQPLPTEAAA